MEVRCAGGVLHACRRWKRAGVELVEASCKCSDAEAWSNGGLDARRRRVDVKAWRSGGVLQGRRRGSM